MTAPAVAPPAYRALIDHWRQAALCRPCSAGTKSACCRRRAPPIGPSSRRSSPGGLKLLFLLTLDAVSLTEAFSDFYQKARLETGTSQAIVNVVHERTERNFLLFSLPRITVRADVVEFEDAPAAAPSVE